MSLYLVICDLHAILLQQNDITLILIIYNRLSGTTNTYFYETYLFTLVLKVLILVLLSVYYLLCVCLVNDDVGLNVLKYRADTLGTIWLVFTQF